MGILNKSTLQTPTSAGAMPDESLQRAIVAIGVSLATMPSIATDSSGNAVGLVGPGSGWSAPNSGIAVYPTGGADDQPNVQAAATLAIAAGRNLILGPGTFNFPTTGITCLGSTSVVNNGGYKALKIFGAGSGLTTVNLGANVVGFWWHTQGQTLNSMLQGGIFNMSIVGTGINNGAIGFQVGGKEASRSNLCTGFAFDDLVIDNVMSCAIFDDTTIIDGSNFWFVRFKYGFEWGYNIDTVTLRSYFMGYNYNAMVNRTVTITSGSNVVTVPADCAAALQLGYAIIAFTATPGQTAFPAGSYVGSINTGTNQITIVDYKGTAVNATGNATAAYFVVGRSFCFGPRINDTVAGTLYTQYSSQFTSPYWSTISVAQRGRVNANQHKYFGCNEMVEVVSDIGDSSHHDIEHHIYDERVAQPYVLGDAASTQISKNLKWYGSYPSTPSLFLLPWINVRSTSGSGVNCEIEVKNCSTDAAGAYLPYLRTYTYGGQYITWADNDLPTVTPSTMPNVAVFSTTLFGTGYYLNSFKAMYIGGARRGDNFVGNSAMGAVAVGGAYSWNYAGQDGFVFSVTGNATLNNPAASSSDIGKVFTVVAVQNATGGFTFTFGTQFKALNGANLGTIAAGTASQRMVANFIWDGTYFWAQNTPTFVT